MERGCRLKFNLRAMAVLLMVIISIGQMGTIYAAKPGVTATSAILIDAHTGNVLYEKNAEKKMYPASTTKIMTALVALEAVANEEISLSQPLSLSQAAYDSLDIDGSSIGLKPGEKMSLEGLLVFSL